MTQPEARENGLCLVFDSLHLEHNGSDTVGTAGYDCIFISHPRREIPRRFQRQQNLMKIVPSPGTEVLGLIGVFDHKLLLIGEDATGRRIRLAIFVGQILLEHPF